MGTIYVGVGDYAVTKNPDDILKTIALGSCVGVILLAPSIRTIGLLHVALPDSSINQKRVAEKPGMFADTGIPALLKEMRKAGWQEGGIIVKLAGGASIMDPNNTFNIGKRNALAVKEILKKFKLGSLAEDLGDSISRSITVEVKTGRVILSSPGRGKWEI